LLSSIGELDAGEIKKTLSPSNLAIAAGPGRALPVIA